MKNKYALVRPVPASYNKCIRTSRVKINVRLAEKQHEEYCKALKELGLKLIWVGRDDSLPDSCFIEDTAAIFDEKAIICNMKIKSRREEVVEVAKMLGNFKILHFVRFPATIDGGDVLKIEDKVFIGLTFRTNMQAVTHLKRY